MPETLTARSILVAGAVLALAVVVWILARDTEAPASTAAYLAPFLAAFAAYKGALAVDGAIHLRRPESPHTQRLIEHHGSIGATRAWIAYKAAAALVATVAAIYCVTRIL